MVVAVVVIQHWWVRGGAAENITTVQHLLCQRAVGYNVMQCINTIFAR